VTLAAGMACEGLKPVVAIYSSFLQRAYDQLIHDVALQNLDVTLAVDRGGLVGPDGATHAGSFDLSFCRPIPNLIILAPSNENECRRMLKTAYEHPGPAMVRYPRGSGPGVAIDTSAPALPIGKGEVVRRGQRLALLAFGSLVTSALAAAEEFDATVVDMRFVKPLDEMLILELAETHEILVTLEENAIGSGVAEVLATHGRVARCLHLGLPDTYIEHAEHAQQLTSIGLDTPGIIASLRAELARAG
jgi:1-deoxy-D-xylulose-5-phosphate synthase